LAPQHIGPVQADRLHRDAHFIGARCGHGDLLELQNLSTAELVEANHLAHTKILLERLAAAGLKQPTTSI